VEHDPAGAGQERRGGFFRPTCGNARPRGDDEPDARDEQGTAGAECDGRGGGGDGNGEQETQGADGDGFMKKSAARVNLTVGRALAAAVLFIFAIVGSSCGQKHARFAPPPDPPEPPEGEGWFCFHATTPHRLSLCKRDRDACMRARTSTVADKIVEEEVPVSATAITAPTHALAQAEPVEDDAPEGSDAPPEASGQFLSS
jgi:hypothetical protein